MIKPKPKPPTTTCASCRHFRRDSSGISFNVLTHEFFMGVCALGLTPHSPIKQFADKPHHCTKHHGKN